MLNEDNNKRKVGLHRQHSMNLLLQEERNNKTIEKNFLENCLGLSFFRIPEFRKEIIDTLELKLASYEKSIINSIYFKDFDK